MMRPEITANNEYHTPENYPHLLIDRITGQTRFVFTALYLKTVFESRSYARKGIYDSTLWVKTSRDIFANVERCGGRFHITGLNHLKNLSGPALILSNHMSTLETMIFPGIIQPIRPVTFVVKDALVRHWAFRDVMISRSPIVLSRENPREDFKIVMEQGAEKLAKGISIVIFPQGTRKEVFVPQEFNSLGTKLAAKTGVPVIPVAIKTDFWGFSKVSSYLGPIHRDRPVMIEFGEPLYVHGTGKDEHQHIVNFIDQRIKSWMK